MLDERGELDECRGVPGVGAAGVLYALRPDGPDVGSVPDKTGIGFADKNIDWDGNGVFEGENCGPILRDIAADINGDSRKTKLQGHNDWKLFSKGGELRLDFQNSQCFKEGFHGGCWTGALAGLPPVKEPTIPAEYEELTEFKKKRGIDKARGPFKAPTLEISPPTDTNIGKPDANHAFAAQIVTRIQDGQKVLATSGQVTCDITQGPNASGTSWITSGTDITDVVDSETTAKAQATISADDRDADFAYQNPEGNLSTDRIVCAATVGGHNLRAEATKQWVPKTPSFTDFGLLALALLLIIGMAFLLHRRSYAQS